MVNSLENIDKSKVDVSRIEGIDEEIQSQISGMITGAASTIITSDLTANRAVISSSNGKVAVSSNITTTELGYLDGVTSSIQTQINGKQDTIDSSHKLSADLLSEGTTNKLVSASEKSTWNGKQDAISGAATTVISSNLTANRALISNNSGKIAVSSITSTKLGYLTDVTSNIQAQLNSKAGAVVGSIIAYAGSSIPTGYLLCDGSAISRTTYSALFSAIGTTYGAGDGNSTFNIPNFKVPTNTLMPVCTGPENNYTYTGEPNALHFKGFFDNKDIQFENSKCYDIVGIKSTTNEFLNARVGDIYNIQEEGTPPPYLYPTNLYADLSLNSVDAIIKY